jgi:hypothetical protein
MAAVKASGVVLYAEASHPSPTWATRRMPAREPKLPTDTGCRGSAAAGGAARRPARRSYSAIAVTSVSRTPHAPTPSLVWPERP